MRLSTELSKFKVNFQNLCAIFFFVSTKSFDFNIFDSSYTNNKYVFLIKFSSVHSGLFDGHFSNENKLIQRKIFALFNHTHVLSVLKRFFISSLSP